MLRTSFEIEDFTVAHLCKLCKECVYNFWLEPLEIGVGQFLGKMSLDGLVLSRKASLDVIYFYKAVLDGCPSSPSNVKSAVNRHLYFLAVDIV